MSSMGSPGRCDERLQSSCLCDEIGVLPGGPVWRKPWQWHGLSCDTCSASTCTPWRVYLQALYMMTRLLASMLYLGSWLRQVSGFSKTPGSLSTDGTVIVHKWDADSMDWHAYRQQLKAKILRKVA